MERARAIFGLLKSFSGANETGFNSIKTILRDMPSAINTSAVQLPNTTDVLPPSRYFELSQNVSGLLASYNGVFTQNLTNVLVKYPYSSPNSPFRQNVSAAVIFQGLNAFSSSNMSLPKGDIMKLVTVLLNPDIDPMEDIGAIAYNLVDGLLYTVHRNDDSFSKLVMFLDALPEAAEINLNFASYLQQVLSGPLTIDDVDFVLAQFKRDLRGSPLADPGVQRLIQAVFQSMPSRSFEFSAWTKLFTVFGLPNEPYRDYW